jgi:hypothetical protein
MSNPYLRIEMWATRVGGNGAMGEVVIGCGEAGEVVCAKDVGGSVVEGVEMEGPRAGPDEGGEGGRTDVFFFVRCMFYVVRGSGYGVGIVGVMRCNY